MENFVFKKSEVVSKDEEFEVYKLFGYSLDFLDNPNKAAENKSQILIDIEKNPLKFFMLPKTVTYLKITGDNPFFYDMALASFEKGIKKPEFKKFIEEKGLGITSLVVKSRKDFLSASEEVDEIKAKLKNEKRKNKRKNG